LKKWFPWWLDADDIDPCTWAAVAAAAVQVEAEAVASSDVLSAAKDVLVSQPEGLLQRLLGQVMDLMGVQHLEGLPAAVNRVSVQPNTWVGGGSSGCWVRCRKARWRCSSSRDRLQR
jgi:hypothetical protein